MSGPRLVYVGHTGTGFDQKELDRVWRLLKPLEIPQSPFGEPIKTNEPPHWARPELVAQVRFTEWTADRKLRHPVYLGLRDDKKASEVTGTTPCAARDSREWESSRLRVAHEHKPRCGALRRSGAEARPHAHQEMQTRRLQLPHRQARSSRSSRHWRTRARTGRSSSPMADGSASRTCGRCSGQSPKFTKGDLLRYYARVSPLILPAVADRPLVMKRFPNGIDKPAFYQQRSRIEQPPAGVRIETIAGDLDPISEPDARRFVGGNLITLLYMTQIAAISQDPWFSRVQSPPDADYVALDLDPGDGTPFSRVVDVARWIRDELAVACACRACRRRRDREACTSTFPLPPGTAYESGMLFCQIIATLIAARHPKAATVERMVRARPRGTVYVDYLQNILGKTLATAYSARASEFAGVSTPLRWEELDEPFDPRDFTIATAPQRFASMPDLWSRLRTARPASFEAVFRK